MHQARKHLGIWNKDSTSVKPLHQLEQLEPRILLSADSLLNINPEPLHDTLLNNTQQEIQYAELLCTNEQVEEQISLEAQPVEPDIEAYEPIFTLLVDDDNANDESADADLSLDNIDYAQVKNDVVLLLNDSDGNIESLGITEGYIPLICNDDNISIEENTSIEIRGPPLTLNEMAFQDSYLTGDLLPVQDGAIVLSDGQILFLGSGPTPSELNLSVPTNINAADTLNTDQLWPGGGLGLDLTGSGLNVGIWEAGDGYGGNYVRFTHQELAGRVVFGDTSGTPVFSDHATHVAGTIAASGVNAAAHGMASEINIRSYSVDDFIQEMYDDASLIVASNHSYSEVVGWSIVNVSGVGVTDIWIGDRSISSTESAAFGKYDAFTNDLDDVLIDNPYLLSVWSAGNDRNDHFTNYRGDNTYVTFLSTNPGIGGWSGSGWYLVPNSGVTSAPSSDGNGGTGYDSLPPDQVAKNSLVVGAINDITADPYNLTDVTMTTFSSWGPTDDGRIKPDVVANGLSLFSSGAGANDDYFQASGTSMAAPNVTGTAALLIHYYESLFGYRPLSATTKGLLIHTAFDAGNLGPDFTYGWGVVDAAAAATFLGNTKFPTPSTMISEDTYTGFEKKYYFESSGTDPLKSTLIWTDPEGNPQGSGIDDNTSVLVHDLDLWITDPDGLTYYPWTLNASLPGDPAVRTDPNHVDNVEQVLIDTPKNGTYIIHVGTSGSAFTQDFSLLVDALCYAPQPVVYSQDFESGMPQADNGWWYYWDNDGYIKVENGHLIMAEANPDMEILGNSQIIADGDTTPSVSDDTYFGGTQQGNSIVRTFTIKNSGSEVLNLTGSPDKVIITGSSDFIITQQPTSPVAAIGGTTTFEITFTPSSYGTKNATISIANNDDYKNPFDFVVQGYVSLFGSQQVISTQADAANSVYACDLDGDGDDDVLSASTIDDKIAWYENLGGGAFGGQQVISTQARFANSVYACDLDGDGDNDVLSASTFDDKVAWYENLGGGSFGPQQVLDSSLDYAPSVYASDLDGDGDKDILSVSTYNDTIAWYENLGGGTFSSRQVVSTQSDGPTSVYACDMDGDGDNDVLAASRTLQVNDKIAWYENQGGGSFGSEHIISTQVDDPYHVYAGDLDDDGDYDVISTSYNDDKIAWYENLGGGTFGGQQVISTQANGVWSSYVCDLDGDGDNDILSASSDDDTVAWYENQGGGAFGSQRVISTQADRVRSVFACDLDGDGDNDVLSASVTDDKVAWYENLGMGATPTYTNNQIFLSDDFTDGNYDGWSLVDQGTMGGSMAWSAASGVMIQSSNVHSTISIDPIAKLGTYAYWQAGTGWTDYTALVTIKSTDNDAIGIMFRYQDENNYYRFIWDAERKSRQLVKCENGVFSILAEDSVPYVTGKEYQVKIAVQGDLLQVSIDGSPVFSVTNSSFSSGSIALYSWGNAGSYFDNILVESVSGGNQIPVISSVTASPSTILDTQTSQLQVNASDPDSGPNPSLTYNWIVLSGQGILDSYNIESPTYTPPDVSTTEIFTLTVEVSDGAAETSQTVDIMVNDAGGVPQILLSEDFNDGNYNGWTLVDQGTLAGPMAWSAASGTMVQSSNVHSTISIDPIAKLGTFAYWQAGIGWTDYTATVKIKSTDNDAIGIMFRYQDENNYYRFIWDKERNSRQLVKCENGVFSILAEDSVPYVTGKNYQVKIAVQGNLLNVSIDGSPVFSVNDSSFSSGSIALYSWGNSSSYFDDIVVDSFINGGGGTTFLNEAILHMDLSGMSNIVLTLDHWNLSDSSESIPDSFVGHYNGDGISLSIDGQNWVKITDLTTDFMNQYFSLDAALQQAQAAAGSTDLSRVRIKIQQYGDESAGSGWREFDNIMITMLFGGQQIVSSQADGGWSVYASDLDGDGDNDVLSASYNDDKIAWYENLGDGTFGSQQVVSTQANGAQSVYACDLDGDGDNDVLSASYYDNKIAWYENLGSGNFGVQQIISTVANGARSVYASDLDGDGDNDVLSASDDDSKIAWYENLGGGTFGSQQVITNLVSRGWAVYTSDLDGDGDNDVLSASVLDDKIAWYENLGGGTFGSQQIISTQAEYARSVYACDMDGDGDNDVLSASYNDNKIAWYENLGGGTFGGQQVISNQASQAMSVYACDLDGDGDNDVLSASLDDDKIAWYENLGGGTFGGQQVISLQADFARSVYACDLDGDGDNDVLSASSDDDKIAWYENLGSVVVGSPEIDIERNGTDDVHIHSFGNVQVGQTISQVFTVRNEGNAALVVTQATGLISPFSISPANNSGSADDWIIPAGATQTFTVSFSPVDAENFNDILVITSNDSDESSYLISFTAAGTGPEIEVLGNSQIIMDGDITPDSADNTDFGIVSVSSSVTRTFTIRNSGSEDLNLTGSPYRVVIAGSTDFTVTQQPTSPVAANGGTTTFEVTFDPSSHGTETATVSITSNDYNENPYDFVIQGKSLRFDNQQIISSAADGAYSVYACDLDGDGDNDVLSASAFDNKIAWYENLGGGAFGSQQVISIQGNGARWVYACDLDSDGDNDVLSASVNDDTISWYENLGGGTFGSQQVVSTQADGAASVYACDLDGDGDNDILSASVYDDKIAWYENQGGGTFGSQQVIDSQIDYAASVYASDLDGDGDNDVLATSRQDDGVFWFENLGGGIFGGQQLISILADGAMSVYACDLDGDGDNDVLSASQQDDKISWYENLGGGTFGGQQVISILADGTYNVYACDLDGDGDNDVLSASYGDDKVAWYENLGSGTFGNQQVISTLANGVYSVYACDLDGDGDNDVISASVDDDKIAWYENLGTASPGPQILLSDDFNDGNYNGWSLVDQGTLAGPMAWSASSGVMVQSSNVHSTISIDPIAKLGTYAYWQAGAGWTDYTATVAIKSTDNDALGIMFRYQDENNYYRFIWDAERKSRQLVKCENGVFSILAEDSVPYVTGKEYQVKIAVQGSSLQVSIDGSPVFSATDSSFSAGSIALYSWGNSSSYFDDILVEGLSGANQAPVISSVTASPSTISDTQTSQLQVNASDFDGPNALTYSWTVPSGQGSLNNLYIANPVYTPPDVSTTEVFTLMVEVSDGAAVTSQTVDITVNDAGTGPQILLSEDFNDGNYNGWTLVDQGTLAGPMAWSAASGVMVQSSNVHSTISIDPVAKLGTYAYWQAGTGWTDYVAYVSIKSTDNDAIGIMFRYQDENNYYRFIWDKERNSRQVVKCENGVFSILAEDSVPYVTGTTYQVRISVQGSLLQVSIEGSPVFSATDSSFSSGSIALYSWGNSSSYFDDILVENSP